MKKISSLLSILVTSIICLAQNVGIGTTNPTSNLHISAGSSGVTSGFSPLLVESNVNAYVNIQAPNIHETGVLFGLPANAADGGIVYNNGTALRGLSFRTGGNNTRMTLDQSGRLGIGIATPAYRLDIHGRMRIRAGNDGDAGIWFSRGDNLQEQAFMGMENNDYVGLYGLTAGWKFSMNVHTGALKVNGSQGTAGQVLISNGNAPNEFISMTNLCKTAYAAPFYASGDVNGWEIFCSNNSEVQIPSLTTTITVNYPSRLTINGAAHFHSPCAGFDCAGTVRFYFKINGTSAKEIQMVTQTEMQVINISDYFWDVPAGTHTITFWCKKGRTDDNNLIGNAIYATVKALPQ